MQKYLTKSNIITLIVILILFGYVGYLKYQVHKEHKIYLIGMCAKDKSSRYNWIKNADDIKKAIKNFSGYYRYFQRCEDEYSRAPKAMELKYKKD